MVSAYGLPLGEALEKQLQQGADRTRIATWLGEAIPR